MDTITKIAVQKRDKDRVNIDLNGKFFCSLEMEVAVKHNLRVGTSIAESRLAEIQLESEKLSAFNKVLKLISVRYKTQREVEKYLYEKGYVAGVVYYCINKLNEYHYLDDDRYAESYINAHKNRYGILKLKQELMLKGVSEEICDKYLSEFSQENQILVLAEKYMKNKEKNKENYQKLIRHLMGKGFPFEDIKNALKSEEFLGEEWCLLAMILWK